MTGPSQGRVRWRMIVAIGACCGLVWMVVVWRMASDAVGPKPAAAWATVEQEILPKKCVECHGRERCEGGVDLTSPSGTARGDGDEAIVVAGRPEESRIWKAVRETTGPHQGLLTDAELSAVRQWIAEGTTNLPHIEYVEVAGEDPQYDSSWLDHWAFRKFEVAAVPVAGSPQEKDGPRDEVPGEVAEDEPAPGETAAGAPENGTRTPAERRTTEETDRLLRARLEAVGLDFGPEADRATLVRRVALGLTGLPPTAEEIRRFEEDVEPGAYSRMVDRYLDSVHYGERSAQEWLDVAGYADSNGYFDDDTERPHAYLYRDYVVSAFNGDLPYDAFVREQLAGDELVGYRPGVPFSSRDAGRLAATHFLLNAPDGTASSDGNPDEVRADKYAVLEAELQILGSALWGVTLHCARCHDHKFEPIRQQDYYSLQAVLYPVLNVENWQLRSERIATVRLADVPEDADARNAALAAQIDEARGAYRGWLHSRRPVGRVLFSDSFDGRDDVEAGAYARLASRWRRNAPGDAESGVTFSIDGSQAPRATAEEGRLVVETGPGAYDDFLSTSQAFDWVPSRPGESIQATFDFVADRLSATAPATRRIAFMIAAHDLDDDGSVRYGNLLLEARPVGGLRATLDHPGGDAEYLGVVGSARVEPGSNLGIRVTRLANDRVRLEELVDFAPSKPAIEIPADRLPRGGFAFRIVHGRDFVADDVSIEEFSGGGARVHRPKEAAGFLKEARERLDSMRRKVAELSSGLVRTSLEIPLARDSVPWLPNVRLLRRGIPGQLGPRMAPSGPSFLSGTGRPVPLEIGVPATGATGTGTRTAFARWVTEPGSRQAALLARVHVNRVWARHFGAGLVSTTSNLGVSGAAPTHPELLETLAVRFATGGWSTKSLLRSLLDTQAYRQSAASRPEGERLDPRVRLLWRQRSRRLTAEEIRDGILLVSDGLDRELGGPAVPTLRHADGLIVGEAGEGGQRRSIYLNHRRSQMPTFLRLFGAPAMPIHCLDRYQGSTPLQALALLNSEFCRERALQLADRIESLAGGDRRRQVEVGFLLAFARRPTSREIDETLEFVAAQEQQYAGHAEASLRAWSDACQAWFASNEFVHVE